MPGVGEVMLLFLATMVIFGSNRLPGALDRPARASLGDWALLAGFGLCLGAFVDLVALPLVRAGAWSRLALVLGIAAAWTLAMNGGLARTLRTRAGAALRRRRLRRHTRRSAPLPGEAPLAEQPAVRLVGTVEADRPGRSRFGGRPAVVSHHLVRGQFGGLIDEGTTGDDFTLRLPGGARVRVCVREALATGALALAAGARETWTGRPVAQASVGWFEERRILPGDVVQVVGDLRRVLDLQAAAAGPRALPVGWAVVAPRRGPLAVLAPDEDRG